MSKPIRDPVPIPQALAEIEAVWLDHPDLSLIQLLIQAGLHSAHRFFVMTDDELLRCLHAFNAPSVETPPRAEKVELFQPCQRGQHESCAQHYVWENFSIRCSCACHGKDADAP